MLLDTNQQINYKKVTKMNTNEFKKVIVYMLAVAITTFAICVCFEVYYMKQELSEIYQHNNQLLELRVVHLEEILK